MRQTRYPLLDELSTCRNGGLFFASSKWELFSPTSRQGWTCPQSTTRQRHNPPSRVENRWSGSVHIFGTGGSVKGLQIPSECTSKGQIEDSNIHVIKLLIYSSVKDAKKNFRAFHKEKGITKPCKNTGKLSGDQSIPKPWNLILLIVTGMLGEQSKVISLTYNRYTAVPQFACHQWVSSKVDTMPGTEATLQGPIFLRLVCICGGRSKTAPIPQREFH